jgi:transcriptional regulator with XRE-family HTH domain
MTKKFAELEAKMSPQARARSDEIFKALLADMPLAELRHAHSLSQQALAERLGVNQAAVSKLERRTDMYVSTLRQYVEAMGGELHIIARFPEGEVRITSFSGQFDEEEAH